MKFTIFNILLFILAFSVHSFALASEKDKKKIDGSSSVANKSTCTDCADSLNMDVNKAIDDTLVYDDYEVPGMNKNKGMQVEEKLVHSDKNTISEQQRDAFMKGKKNEESTDLSVDDGSGETKKTLIEVSVYPNPVVSGGNITLNAPMGTVCSVRNLSGNVLDQKTCTTEETKINLTERGLLFVILNYESEQKVIKLLVK